MPNPVYTLYIRYVNLIDIFSKLMENTENPKKYTLIRTDSICERSYIIMSINFT